MFGLFRIESGLDVLDAPLFVVLFELFFLLVAVALAFDDDFEPFESQDLRVDIFRGFHWIQRDSVPLVGLD